jgi:uncharacterized repeat protein (TIGR03803 family)
MSVFAPGRATSACSAPIAAGLGKKLVLAGMALACCAPPVQARAADTFKTIVDFAFYPNGGSNPMGGAFYYKGALWGATSGGGVDARGAIYRYKPGTGGLIDQVRLAYDFTGGFGGVDDIGMPESEITVANGIFYGVGGTLGEFANSGVYQYNVQTGAETLLYAWPCYEPETAPNAVTVVGSLIYGTTARDCASNSPNGTIFALNPATKTQTVLYSFAGGSDGATPLAGLTLVNGVLYGTTSSGGANNVGTIFSFNPATNTKTTLYSFVPATDGTFPQATLATANGLLYGTTYAGGPNYAGGVFSFDPATNTETNLHSFNGRDEGQNPLAPLLFVHGALYGTTSNGGSGGVGTVFAIDATTGREKLIHSFSGADGEGPIGALSFRAGLFTGTTYRGGGFGTGTIYQFTR